MLIDYALMQPTTATIMTPLVYAAVYALISFSHIINMTTEEEGDTK